MVRGLLSAGRRRAERSDQGFCFGAASTADQPLAETFLAVRAAPNRRLLLSVGSAFWATYVAYSKASKALKTIVAGWSATERR